jgi:hypothetical protein
VFPSLCVPGVSTGNLATSPVPGTVLSIEVQHATELMLPHLKHVAIRLCFPGSNFLLECISQTTVSCTVKVALSRHIIEHGLYRISIFYNTNFNVTAFVSECPSRALRCSGKEVVTGGREQLPQLHLGPISDRNVCNLCSNHLHKPHHYLLQHLLDCLTMLHVQAV